MKTGKERKQENKKSGNKQKATKEWEKTIKKSGGNQKSGKQPKAGKRTKTDSDKEEPTGHCVQLT